MSKVIAFLGSPRKKGVSGRLVEQVLAGAKSAGAETVIYNLNDEGVKGCQGCDYCRTKDGCATKDKLQPMYADIKDADGIVAGFPIYFFNIGGQSKLLIDRLFPMLGEKFIPRHPGKNVVSVYAQGNDNKEAYKGAIEQNDSFFKMFGWNLVDSILSFGGGHDLNYNIPQELMERAYEAGKRLVK